MSLPSGLVAESPELTHWISFEPTETTQYSFNSNRGENSEKQTSAARRKVETAPELSSTLAAITTDCSEISKAIADTWSVKVTSQEGSTAERGIVTIAESKDHSINAESEEEALCEIGLLEAVKEMLGDGLEEGHRPRVVLH